MIDYLLIVDRSLQPSCDGADKGTARRPCMACQGAEATWCHDGDCRLLMADADVVGDDKIAHCSCKGYVFVLDSTTVALPAA